MRVGWLVVALAIAVVVPAAGADEDKRAGQDVPVPVRAADVDQDLRFGQEILEILRDEGTIDQARYEELSEKEAAEALALDEADEEGWTISYKRGLLFTRNDGMAKFKIGGRIQGDFATIHVSDSLEAAVPGGDGEGVEFRRARFFMSGEIYKRIIWKSQIDFAGGDVTIADMYIGMKGLGFLGTALVGHQKEPYSLEELTSSKYITFMERALPSVFDSARNFGLSFSNTAFDKRMTWRAGIFAPTGATGQFFSGSGDFNVAGRITGLPVYKDGGRKLVHIGVAGSYGVRDDSDYRFRQRPEVHLAQRYLDTGAGLHQTDGIGLLGVEFAAVCGPAHFSTEWKEAWVDETIGGTARIGGGYAAVGYFLTGEHRPYKTSNGTWVGVDPLQPFDPAEGHWGAWEVATRYSYIDVNDEAIRGGREQNVTVALNWYLYDSVRMSANYVYADVKDSGQAGGAPTRASGHINTFQMRAQIEF